MISRVSELTLTVLHSASGGAALLGMFLMIQRRRVAFAYRAAALLFGLLALIQAGEIATTGVARPPVWIIQLSGGLVALGFPTAWLYLRDLTSEASRPFTRRDLWHFALPALFAGHVIWAALFAGELHPRVFRSDGRLQGEGCGSDRDVSRRYADEVRPGGLA